MTPSMDSQGLQDNPVMDGAVLLQYKGFVDRGSRNDALASHPRTPNTLWHKPP
jgi:hypothetical protein